MSEGELRLYKDLVNSEYVSHIDFKLIAKKLFDELQQKENIIKEVREYVEENWISQKDADNYRFDDEELNIEISDIAVLFDVLDKEVN